MKRRRTTEVRRATTATHLAALLLFAHLHCHTLAFSIDEATIQNINAAFGSGALTSTQLTRHYLRRIAALNPSLHAVIEVNPEALQMARKADRERKKAGRVIGGLHGIPVLLKDNIATFDKLNTTAGSFAMLGSKVPRDAGVVARLLKAGAIILGKANLSEWAGFRPTPAGWSARGGQTKNPYVLSASPCGSSSGSAVGVAANLATVSLGTETDGSILCPASRNAVVGIKPTVGLSSRAGVVPLSHHQDSVGPLCRTVTDAVEVLDAIVGQDPLDAATTTAASFIPERGYKQFLRTDGLHGKRLGVVRHPFLHLETPPSEQDVFDELLLLMKENGAQIVDNLTISRIDDLLEGKAELTVLSYDFKQDLKTYLEQLVTSPVRSLADVIAFNKEHEEEEELRLYGQEDLYKAEKTTGFDSKIYREAVVRDQWLTQNGIDALLKEEKLDAIVAPSDTSITSVVAIAGYPGISVPAGYTNGVPFGICIVGKKGWEPSLIQIAYSLEQATLIRKPPSFLP